jgi:membrane protein implicated in regulation of membrane protease activity
MFAFYLFALVVGGALLLYSLVGGHDSHGGDVADHDVGHHGAGEWFSVRTLTYFLFVFGGVGAVLTKTWTAALAPLVAFIAILAGAGVSASVAAAFRYLRRTESGFRDGGDESFVGLTGVVTLPIATGGMGKVLVQRGDRTFELLASALQSEASGSAKWTSVVVVEMRKGTAVVAPLDDPAAREISSLTHTTE